MAIATRNRICSGKPTPKSFTHSAMGLSPRRRLHGMHEVTRLLAQFEPPRDRGMRWSMVRSNLLPHQTQRWLSRP